MDEWNLPFPIYFSAPAFKHWFHGWDKRAEGNAATSSHKNESEEEWDFQASAAISEEMLTEDDSREEELAASCIAEPEERQPSKLNEEVELAPYGLTG